MPSRGPIGSDFVCERLGADDDLIGECLGIDPAGVSTLIEIGREKLAAEQRATSQRSASDSDLDPSIPTDDLG